MSAATQAMPCQMRIELPRWCGHVESVTTTVKATAERLSWYVATGRTAEIRCTDCTAKDLWPIDLPPTGVGNVEIPVQTQTMQPLNQG